MDEDEEISLNPCSAFCLILLGDAVAVTCTQVRSALSTPTSTDMSSILLYSFAADNSVAILVVSVNFETSRYSLSKHTQRKEVTILTTVKVGNRGTRESDLDLIKCFGSCFSTEARRLCVGVAHRHRGMCRVSLDLWQSREVGGWGWKSHG